MIRKMFYKYSKMSRQKKVELFFRFMEPQRYDVLLDAGGGTGEGFREIWSYFNKVVVVDINKSAIERVRSENFPNVEGIVGNVCELPLKDESVDVVFSNAVIEHIAREERLMFAKEVRRVARKGYFVTTPNFWFPFEPHYLTPFFHFLPEKLKILIKRNFAVGPYRKGKYERIDLLTRSELKQLFPTAQVFGLRVVSFIPETLICWEKIAG